jgi:hypothetical protein
VNAVPEIARDRARLRHIAKLLGKRSTAEHHSEEPIVIVGDAGIAQRRHYCAADVRD